MATSGKAAFFRLGLLILIPGLDITNPPQPETKYCIIILITLEVTQKSASPLGKDKQSTKNIRGIVHSIICPCVFCFGSDATGMDIFCCNHIVAPTITAR